MEDIKDNSGRVIQDAPLELWANLKQRALDVALKEIKKEKRHPTGVGIHRAGNSSEGTELRFSSHCEETCER